MAKNFIAALFICVLVVSGVQCRNLAHISGSLGIIDDIMHYGTHNVTVAIQDSLSSDLKSDDLIFAESRPVDRSDFVHWNFDDDLVKVSDEKQSCDTDRIDMSEFVELVPVKEVQGIVARYYRHDVEVQKGYAYLRSEEFANLKNRIIAIPEMTNFLNYLNESGLDVVGFIYAVTDLTARPEDYPIEIAENENSTVPIESLNGLHGLVDSVLDVLPQDQILSLFFDKLETSELFAKLVDKIGSPEFEKILHKLQDSMALRNLIYTLHNNGIYITRIVDSLKAYFFLGTF